MVLHDKRHPCRQKYYEQIEHRIRPQIVKIVTAVEYEIHREERHDDEDIQCLPAVRRHYLHLRSPLLFQDLEI